MRRLVLLAVILSYVSAFAATSLALHGKSDLDLFYWPVGEMAAAGHPLLIYSTNSMGAGPYANGPLGLIPLVPIVILANAGRWASNVYVRTVVVDAVFACFSLLMAYRGVSLVRQARGTLRWGVAAYVAFLLAPSLWLSVANYGHIEQPIELALILVAAELTLRRRYAPAGVVLGLALLTRTTAALYLLVLVLVPLTASRARGAARVFAAATVTAALGLAPFVTADPVHTLHSLVGYRGDEAIGGGSLLLLGLGTAWAPTLQHVDTYVVLAAAAAMTSVILWRRPVTGQTTSGIFGLLTIAATCFPMLAKTAYPYYLVEPYVFATIWWLASPGSARNWRLIVPILLTCDALLTKQSVSLPSTGAGVATGVVSSAVLALVVLLVASDLFRRPTPLEATPGLSSAAWSGRMSRVAVSGEMV